MDKRLFLFLDGLPGPGCIKDENLKIIFCNRKYAQLCKTDKKNIIGKTIKELFPITDQAVQIFGHAKNDENFWENEKFLEQEVYYYHSDSTAEIFLLQKFIIQNEEGCKIAIGEHFRTITKLKHAEHTLKISQSRLKAKESIIVQKSQALQEIINNIEREKKQINENIQSNLENFIFPIIGKLKLKTENENIKFLELLEENLKDITDPFLKNTPKTFQVLTPRELEICNFIRNGLSSKEIAISLNLSHQTIEKHRNNIRKKLGLKRNINLVSFLKIGKIQ